MRGKLPAILVIILLHLSCALWAQDGVSKKAQKQFSEGLKQYHLHEWQQAEGYFTKAIAADPNWAEPYIMLGNVLQAQDKFDEAIKTYQVLLEKYPDDFPGRLNIAGVYYRTGRYEEAEKAYEYVVGMKGGEKRYKELAADRLKQIRTARELMAHPVPFQPNNLGANINTEVNELFPAFTIDGETLYFTRRKVVDSLPERGIYKYNEDVMVSRKVNGQWAMAHEVEGPINTRDNEAAVSIAPDGSYMVFTGCERPDGLGSCDLYISFFIKGEWTKPVNMQAPVNSRWKETQPSISYDGKSIYFSSNRPGSLGKMDLWITTRDDKFNFSEPRNLGAVINTAEDDQSPFIHPDDQTLYFVSSGHPGMGLNDIFYARKKADGSWDSVTNFGYPVNTSGDEAMLVVDRAGEYAYIASDNNSLGKLDLFYFKMPEGARPKPVTYLKAHVFDNETKKPLMAWLEIVDLQTDKIIIARNTDEKGDIMAALPEGKDYLVNVSASGYIFYSGNIPLSNYSKAEPFKKEIGLDPLKEGAVITLNNVFFASDSYELKKESKSELDRLIAFLNMNKDIKMEISGHTDNTGSPAHNKELSQERAKAVHTYLIKTGGINAARLTYKGYGETKPVAPNTTEEGKALNRRTEVKITR